MLFMLCFGTAWGQRGGTYQHQHNSHHYHNNSHYDNHNHHHATRTHTRASHYSNWSPVCTHDFDIGCRSIRSRRYDRDRLRAAKKFVACHHVTVQQVNCILNMFAYERSRLAFAKYAYSRTCDRSNYDQLYTSFAYRSSCRELNIHISRF
jgi:hypothetical protein